VSLLWGFESSYDYFLDVYLHAAPFLLPCLAVSLGGQRVLHKKLLVLEGFLCTLYNTASSAAPQIPLFQEDAGIEIKDCSDFFTVTLTAY
jgi:hypothetical protein